MPIASQQNEFAVLPVPSIRMVIQRYRHASMLIDEREVVTVGQKSSSLLLSGADNDTPTSSSLGLLAYISFSTSATEEKVEQAAKTILNMPVGTLGAWGDGSTAKSMLQLTADAVKQKELSSSFSIILVPQANLIAKIKRNGKSIQYRDQIAKEKGNELYIKFCRSINSLLLDHQSECRGEQKSSKKSSSTISDPSIPPYQLFRLTRTSEFAAFDETGFPLKTADGQDLTKSAKKRMRKQYEAHVKRHEKYIEKHPNPSVPSPEPATDASTKDNEADTATMEILKLVCGTFGKRQGLELQSDMGPFCHVVEL
jgi:D-Tyr-tRNAtyr deacylase